MNKPYLLLAGDWYYPESGTNNWVDTFETEESAKAECIPYEGCYRDSVCIRGVNYDWYEIVDLREWTNSIKN